METLVIRSEPAAAAQDFVERRRPGRQEFSSSPLISLLRGSAELTPDRLQPEFDDIDQLRPARGLGLALATSLLLWALLGAIWFALT
jgi:hypothetical protein